jgi:hypothetical protein
VTVTGSYDDGENVDDGDALPDEHRHAIDLIRAIQDPAVRRAVFAVFILAVLRGRVGRE